MARKEEFQDKIYIPTLQARDHEIYELCRVRGRTQREAAAKFGISQARVSKIIREVTIFHSLIDPTERGLSREQRCRAAIRLHEQKLDYAAGEADRAWETSGEPQVTFQESYQVVPAQGSADGSGKPALPTKTPEKHTRKVVSKKRDPRYLDRFVKFSEMRLKLEGFDVFGNVDVSDKGRLKDIPDEQDIIANRELKKAAFEGKLDSPGDVGIPKWFMDGVGARHYLDGTPYVSKKGLTTNSAIGNKQVTANSDATNPTRNGALSKQSGSFSEEVTTEQVTEIKSVQNVLSKESEGAELDVVDESVLDGDEKGRKSVEGMEAVVASSAAGQPLAPTLSSRSCAEDREYRGEGEKDAARLSAVESPVVGGSPEPMGSGYATQAGEVSGSGVFSGDRTCSAERGRPENPPDPIEEGAASGAEQQQGVGTIFGSASVGQGEVNSPENGPDPGQRAEPPKPKYQCGTLKVVEEVPPRQHSDSFPELPHLARQAIQTLADHGIRVKPRPADYVDPPPPPERLMPDGLPWARSEEEARRRGYIQWTTDRTPEEESEWNFRHLPQACQKAYNLLDVLEIEVVPMWPDGCLFR